MDISALTPKALMARKRQGGFTLIELLVVIGILAVLLAIVLVAINPARQFEQANNTKRMSDVNAILNAVHQYMAENSGTLPGTITATPTEISSTGVNICAPLVTEYLAALPSNPTLNADPVDEASCAGAYNTGYEISVSATDNRITVSDPDDATITVTR